MSRKSAVIWAIGGVPVAAIDAWLSMQAMFGILNPRNFLGFAVAFAAGIFFTAFAVLSETFGMRRKPFGFLAWTLILVVDMGTSILCAIWYGQFGNPFSRRIQISEIRFDPDNWIYSGIYIAFVVAFAWGCIQLGRAFETLLNSARSG
jgi:hypothetical protein